MKGKEWTKRKGGRRSDQAKHSDRRGDTLGGTEVANKSHTCWGEGNLNRKGY